MKLFMQLNFLNLTKQGSDTITQLPISIGIIDTVGRKFYGELTDSDSLVDRHNANPDIMLVLNSLWKLEGPCIQHHGQITYVKDTHQNKMKDLAKNLRAWLYGYSDNAVVTMYGYDDQGAWHLFKEKFDIFELGTFSSTLIEPELHDIFCCVHIKNNTQIIDYSSFDIFDYAHIKLETPNEKHNALRRAEAIRAAYHTLSIGDILKHIKSIP